MKNYDKVLFVDSDNTSAGVIAEAILQEIFKLEDILVESRGLVVLFPEPVNPKVEEVLLSHELTMKDHTSKPLSGDDFDHRTLVLTLQTSQKETLLRDFENAQNVWTLAQYLGDGFSDPMDPYGGDLNDYGQCYDQLAEMVSLLAERLKEEDR